MNSHRILITVFLLATTFFSCKKDKSDDTSPGQAEVQIMLTDTPGVYDAVLVDILSVEVHTANGGWNALNPINAGVYDLLDFSNGLDTMLGTTMVPAGIVSQIRLMLGPNNSVVDDGITYNLTVPSGIQSGLKLNLHETLQGGITYRFWLDFDAGRSIVKEGNGDYLLKPVIRVFSEATSGAIKGVVVPDSATAHVMAVIGTDTAGTIPDSTGAFLVGGLAAGTYNVIFTNMNGYKDTTIAGVGVTNGVVTDLGLILMKQ